MAEYDHELLSEAAELVDRAKFLIRDIRDVGDLMAELEATSDRLEERADERKPQQRR